MHPVHQASKRYQERRETFSLNLLFLVDIIFENETFDEILDNERKYLSLNEIYDNKQKQNCEVNTMKVLNEIANSIHPMIELTSDIPSNHTDGKLPVLDLKVKLGLKNQIDFQFYEKKTKNSRVILASSALPWRQKETILVNEAVRRLRNTTPQLGSETQNFHLNVFMVKLKNSGYSANFRAKIIRKSRAIYSEQLENDR